MECDGESCIIKKYTFDWDKVTIESVTVYSTCGDKEKKDTVVGSKLSDDQKSAITKGLVERADSDAKWGPGRRARTVVHVKDNQYTLVDASCAEDPDSSCLCLDSGGATTKLPASEKSFAVALIKGHEAFDSKDCSCWRYKVSFHVRVAAETSEGNCLSGEEEEW